MRNILIITVGTTPQIVTETIYALITQPEPFIPAEILLVTTAGAEKTFADLIGEHGKLRQLYHDLGYEDDHVVPQLIFVEDNDGHVVIDVRSEAEAIAFGNTITRLVAHHAKDPATRIHVSLAGGRKTMAWYAGAALSLFGRDQDELSHVLVEPAELEHCPDFWWPASRDHAVAHRFLKDHDGGPRKFDASAGRIDMARIPFVRMTPILTEAPFQGGKADYALVVEAVAENLSEYRVKLILDNRMLIIGRHRIQLDRGPFAFYTLLAAARKERWKPSAATGLSPGYYHGWMTLHDFGTADSRYLQRYYTIFAASHRGEVATAEERLEKAKEELRADYDKFINNFKSLKSKIAGGKGVLRARLPNPTLRSRIDVQNERDPKGQACFGLLLEPNQIEIVESA